MTSVLVECGFLTNEKEASYLNTTNGQDIIASAIYRGFRTTIQKDFPAISFLKSGGSSNSIANSSGNSTPNTTKSTGKFTIQIMSSKEPMDTGGESFKKIGLSVTRKKLNTTSAYKYLYTVGTYDSQEAAKKDLEKVQKNGFKDAYIVKLE
jgi:N-acetylmuramoyl-L-alanine amidase